MTRGGVNRNKVTREPRLVTLRVMCDIWHPAVRRYFITMKTDC